MAPGLSYHHVDVFASRPYTGNSLAVFSQAGGLTTEQMDRITKELRHFESIFLEPAEESRAFRARVFDLIEELEFAGHPVIGAACVLHAIHGTQDAEVVSSGLRYLILPVRRDVLAPAEVTLARLEDDSPGSQRPASALDLAPG
jgi:PhzF family phenazine biosynthesis protein